MALVGKDEQAKTDKGEACWQAARLEPGVAAKELVGLPPVFVGKKPDRFTSTTLKNSTLCQKRA